MPYFEFVIASVAFRMRLRYTFSYFENLIMVTACIIRAGIIIRWHRLPFQVGPMLSYLLQFVQLCLQVISFR